MAAVAGFSSCQDDIDAPDSAVYGPKATLEPNTTILEFKNAFWKDNDYNYCEQFPARADGSHYIIKGWVISDDKGGNIYKTIYIRDETAALSISVNEYNLWLLNRMGQEVVIDVTGMYGGRYSGQMQLGAPKWNTSLNKNTGTFMAPEFYQNHRQLNGLPDESKAQPVEGPSFGELNANTHDSEFLKKWQGQLVRFNNVKFPAADGEETLCSNYQTSVSDEQNRVLEDANGDVIVVRTSGYADFWNTKLPEGSGDVVGILGYYLASPTATINTSAWQLMLLTEDDLMNFGNPTLPKGEMTNPYTVEEAVTMISAGETAIGWVDGYIVGTVKGQVETITSSADIEWGANATLDNTVVIGATPDTQDINECLVISLPQGSAMRQYVALANHPENLGKRLNVRGTLVKYMGAFGVTGNTGTAPEFRLEGVDVPGADEPVPGPTMGDGTAEHPYAPSQVIMTSKPSGATPNVYVKGYIVGFIPAKSISEAQFSLPATIKTNMLLADTPDGNSVATVLPIALPSGNIRDELNLQDHPENFGKLVTLCGSYEAYFGVAGLKSISWYQFDGEGGDTPVTPPVSGGSEILKASFTGSDDGFTFENGTLPAGLSRVWFLADNGYMQASGYSSGKSYAVDGAYLVSPVLDLTGKTSAELTFRQVIGQFRDSSNSLIKPQNVLFYAIREEGGAWGAPVAINDFPEYKSGKNWTDWGDGSIDLTPYVGKKVQVGFKYTSTTSMAGTWEIDNVTVTAK